MKEILDIIQAHKTATQQNKSTALATVVHVEGSSYRRPGARMLVTEDGALTGAISGGCLEGDALKKALHVMLKRKPMLVTYNTNDEDDAKFGLGLGCNGVIQVLIEPLLADDENSPIRFLQTLAEKRQKGVLVTLFSLLDKKEPQPGTCLLCTEAGEVKSKTNNFHDQLLLDAKEAMIKNQSSFKNYVGTVQQVSAFIEMIQPPVSLVIIGAGNDVMPLVQMADILGWQSIVTDGRPAYANKERFANCQVLVAQPENVLRHISIDDRTVFLLMTHNYNYDMAMLPLLLEKQVSYLGMLGPKKKKERMLQELAEKGTVFTDEQLSVLHSPVGLDIGAETPEEIALSIISEIKAVFAGKQPMSLKDNTDVIHARSAFIIEAVTLTQKDQH